MLKYEITTNRSDQIQFQSVLFSTTHLGKDSFVQSLFPNLSRLAGSRDTDSRSAFFLHKLNHFRVCVMSALKWIISRSGVGGGLWEAVEFSDNSDICVNTTFVV